MSDLNLSNQDRVDQFILKANNQEYSFMLTVARDGEIPVRSIYYFNNAHDAINAYSRYNDWGFAKDYLTVSLYEPNGSVTTKVLSRPPAGECTFVKSDYIKAQEILLGFKNQIEYKTYENLVNSFAKLFSQDNIRFDHLRFFKETQCNEVTE